MSLEVATSFQSCLANYEQTGSNANGRRCGMPEHAAETSLAEKPAPGHSLHSGLGAPPTASQAFVPGVASETHDML